MTAYGYGVHGHEQVRWRGTKVSPFGPDNADRMAKKAIEAAVRDAGFGCVFRSLSRTQREVVVNERRLHNGAYAQICAFRFEAKRGGTVAVRIRRLHDEGVHPSQWCEHMPDVLRVDQHVSWTAARPGS
jgi:hypothetical protein